MVQAICKVLNQNMMMDSTLGTIVNCEKCKEPINKKIVLLGRERIVLIACRCRREEFQARKIKDENEEKKSRLKKLMESSLMKGDALEKKFETWDFTKGSQKMYNISFKYAENFNMAKKNNLGLLIYGNCGNGKSHMSFCIANKLLDSGYSVVCTSIEALLNKIKKSFNTWGSEGEIETLNSLSNADLLILDDLGTENITDWSLSKIYNIIDSRYRNKLPLIITTNLKINDLENTYGKRTIDRINEMCTFYHNDGPSIRKEIGKAKNELWKEILK